MREIKFRAWDRTKNKFVGIVDISQHRKYWEFDLGLDDNLVLQQYTGIKDRNGKEICEGDILGGIYDGGYIDWCGRCKQFQFFGCKDECFACGGDVHWFELSVEKELEVIGNIHENPELLNK